MGSPGIFVLGLEAVSSHIRLKEGRSVAKCFSGKLVVLKLTGSSRRQVFSQ